jgi:hypothetical protein
MNALSAPTRRPRLGIRVALALLPVLGSAAPAPVATPDPGISELASVFHGAFDCSGHFANGKLIHSSESFAPALDGHWLIEEHSDAAPFNYRAHALWGVRAEPRALTLTIYDNFGGQRQFVSTGWHESVLAFEPPPTAERSPRVERFLYRTTADGYSVEYQVQDAGGSWKMGDILGCVRRD